MMMVQEGITKKRIFWLGVSSDDSLLFPFRSYSSSELLFHHDQVLEIERCEYLCFSETIINLSHP